VLEKGEDLFSYFYQDVLLQAMAIAVRVAHELNDPSLHTFPIKVVRAPNPLLGVFV